MEQDSLDPRAKLLGAVLSRDVLLRRLREDIVVSPLLDVAKQVGEGSIDISLGTQFILNRSSELSTLDPRTLTAEKLRKFQHALVVPYHRTLTLHPGRFVLGCTLEFIKFPTDVCGFVLSRSSYGRAGLLIATATYVQPGWHGCLTLELENLGEVPIELSPGLRVGQLVIISSERIDQPRLKDIPCGPTFRGLAEDDRWKRLRERFKTSGTAK
jgi:dCTP deaminase